MRADLAAGVFADGQTDGGGTQSAPRFGAL